MPNSGTFASDAEVRLREGVDPLASRLTAEEGFVLSRLDDRASVGTLCLITGLSFDTTLQILARLRDKGIILVGDDEEEPPLVAAHSDVGEAPEITDPPSDGAVEGAAELESDGFAEPASDGAADPPPDADSDLDPQLQRKIRGIHIRLGELNLFELLGLPPTAAEKEIRKAYFIRSKEFHPDRYFKKKLGPYKEMLQEIFKQLRAAYKFLVDAAQREAYRDMVLHQGEQEALAREVERQGLEAQREEEAAQQPGGPRPAADVRYVKGETFRHRKHSPGPRSEHVRRALAEMVKGRPDPLKVKAALQERRAEKEQQRTGQFAPVAPRPRTASSAFFSRSKRAREFFEQGQRQLDKGQHLAATASLKLAATYESENAEYAAAYREAEQRSRALTAENCFKRGVFEESVGRLEAAGASFIRAADQFPKATYLQKAAQACLWQRDLIKAKDYATQAVRRDPESADSHITLAKVYFEAKMAKNAKRELQEALRLEPGNVDAKKLLKNV